MVDLNGKMMKYSYFDYSIYVLLYWTFFPLIMYLMIIILNLEIR